MIGRQPLKSAISATYTQLPGDVVGLSACSGRHTGQPADLLVGLSAGPTLLQQRGLKGALAQHATGFGFGDRCATEQSKERDASVLEVQVLQIVRGVIPLSMATVHS
jgi:hypothetical protein